MLEYQKKKKVRNLMYSKFTLILILIGIGLLCKGVWGLYIKSQESEKNKIAAQAEYNKLIARQTLLSSQIAGLKTPEGIEKEIRSKFNVVKEGEQVVVIVDKSIANENDGVATSTGFWTKIVKFFRK